MGRGIVAVLLALQAVTAVAAQLETTEYQRTYRSHGSFEELRLDLEEAITARGIVVNNVSHIGAMLERTGKDLGASRKVYGQAVALEFCSAGASRKMMEADPHNIVYCPYIIALYTLPGEQDRVYIAYRRPLGGVGEGAKAALLAVEELLDEIVQEVVR